ncbi:MAG TPA: trypsin-like peptidase domain-containing protein [Ktedonobacteraceae bacterium]
MQPTDDRPSRPSNGEQPLDEQSALLAGKQKVTKDLQAAEPESVQYRSIESSAGEHETSRSGASERVLFPAQSSQPAPGQAGTPPVPYQSAQSAPGQAGASFVSQQSAPYPVVPGAPYRPGPAQPPGPAGAAPVPHQPYQPGQAGAAPAWGYPPPPQRYQGGPAGQPLQGGPVTGPAPAVLPGQFGQPRDAYAQPFYSSATVPFGQTAAGGSVPPGAAPRRSGLRTGTLIALVALVALIFGTGLFAGWQFGHSGAATSPVSNSTFQQGNNSTAPVPKQTGGNADAVREAVISKVQPGVVQINVTTGSQQALGSGVIVDKRGYIVTNNHVIANANSIQVTLANNQTLPAQVAGTDAVDDLAVIKITPPSGGLATVTLGDSSQLRVGQEVLAIGSPLGNAETVTSGIISALNRNVSEGQNAPTLPDALQTDAPINPGNSGGALVDLQGNLIGIPTLNAVDTEFNTPANGLGFAIPVNRIRFIAEQIINSGHVSHTGRAILGVTVTSVTQSVAAQNHLSINSGVLIVNVTAGGPSASAGIKAGDVIVQVGNHAVNSTSDLSAALLQQKPGDSVQLKINRFGQQLTLNVTLGELAAG